MEENKYNLLYKPNLAPDRHFESDASFEKFVPIRDIGESSENRPKEEDAPKILKESIRELKELTPLLPPSLKFISRALLDPIEKRIDTLWPDGKFKREIENKIEYIPPDIETPINYIPIEYESMQAKIPGIPNLFPSDNNIKLKIEVPNSIVEIVQQDYKKNSIDLFSDYVSTLQTVFQRYFQNMFMVMSELGIDDISVLNRDFDADTVSVPPNKGLEHCRDHIVRARITNEQISRIFKKSHNEDESLMHLRSWQIAAKARERYYTEEYADSGEYITSHSNAILRNAREQFNQRYFGAFYDMYRYFNSAAMITQDILTNTVTEAQAKGMLLKNGVNIFENDDAQGISLET